MDNFDLKKYLVENKVTTNSRMLVENEDTSIAEQSATQFPDFVEKYGLKAVATALDVVYENTWYNTKEEGRFDSDEDIDRVAEKKFMDAVQDFKKNPASLEDMIEEYSEKD